MIRKIRERINLFIAKSPQKAVLVGIMLFNLFFILLSAGIIAVLSTHMRGLKECSFWEAVYHTILMVLDAGCVESVIADVGKAGLLAVIVCLAVVVLGMMFFSGAIIGYITNDISNFIESKNNGKNKLLISNHIVIINWNERASEIINEFLYNRKAVKVIVFVGDRRSEIDEEIRNRLDATLMREERQVLEAAEGLSFFEKRKYLRENLLKDKITYIVREGDIAAETDLDDICISKARTVIILEKECDETEHSSANSRGNIQTVKTLIQVSEISKANSSQTILVEVGDSRTEELVYKIIEHSQKEGKEIIIPVSFNRLLGKTHSHIAIMPELYDIYENLFSNNGMHFISRSVSDSSLCSNAHEFIKKHLYENCTSIPLTVMDTMKGIRAFFLAARRSELNESREKFATDLRVGLQKDNLFRKRCIVVFGHNSDMDSLMEGFDLFRKETKQNNGEEAICILMADDEESLRQHHYYKEYPYVVAVPVNVYDENCFGAIESFAVSAEETTLLIISDDQAGPEETDANVLTYLIYIQEKIRQMEVLDPEFRRERIDVVAEILNPKNEDVVRNYGADKVIIRNRFLSRVISQVSLGETVVEFFADVLSYVFDEGHENGNEIYIKSAEDFFTDIPGKCTAAELIRAVYESCEDDNRLILFGYIRNKTDYVYFSGDQRRIEVSLEPDDKLMIFGKRIV